MENKINKVPIVEIFETVQGEGVNLGLPSIFVRLWGCNLRCQFDGKQCDTPYAVKEERDKAKNMTALEVVEEIRKLNPIHIVWTGGEPMMFQPFISEVISYLIGFGYSHEVETNGTLKCSEALFYSVNNFNLSVKLKGSNQENEEYDKKRINFESINSYPVDKSIFKFVINTEEDKVEAMDIASHFQLPIYLMPQGATREEIIKNSPDVIQLCIETGCNFSPREHIMVWSNKRGV
jgi:organic radical activating enzyme